MRKPWWSRHPRSLTFLTSLGKPLRKLRSRLRDKPAPCPRLKLLPPLLASGRSCLQVHATIAAELHCAVLCMI